MKTRKPAKRNKTLFRNPREKNSDSIGNVAMRKMWGSYNGKECEQVEDQEIRLRKIRCQNVIWKSMKEQNLIKRSESPEDEVESET
jgi:hypothetical protein